MKNQTLLIVAAIVIAAFSLFPKPGTVPVPPPAPVPAPAPSPSPVSSDLAKAFASVAPGDRALVGSVYAALADAVSRDTTLVTSTKVLADGIGRSLDLAFDGRTPSPDGSLGVAIDKHLAESLGFPTGELLDVIVTPTMRPKIVAALRSVAEAAR